LANRNLEWEDIRHCLRTRQIKGVKQKSLARFFNARKIGKSKRRICKKNVTKQEVIDSARLELEATGRRPTPKSQSLIEYGPLKGKATWESIHSRLKRGQIKGCDQKSLGRFFDAMGIAKHKQFISKDAVTQNELPEFDEDSLTDEIIRIDVGEVGNISQQRLSSIYSNETLTGFVVSLNAPETANDNQRFFEGLIDLYLKKEGLELNTYSSDECFNPEAQNTNRENYTACLVTDSASDRLYMYLSPSFSLRLQNDPEIEFSLPQDILKEVDLIIRKKQALEAREAQEVQGPSNESEICSDLSGFIQDFLTCKGWYGIYCNVR